MALRLGVCFSLLACGSIFSAAPVDESKLPPPATNHIDFTRDIKPILETSCLRCHGPERPKSRFRLDNREAALKGGDNGVDIIPGNSAKSPFIHYVSYLVEDMEMPPTGKGQRLTPEQIALLRAWIDQGVSWEAPSPARNSIFSFAPTVRETFVTGDNHKFREHYWQRENLNDGLEYFDFSDQASSGTKVTITGHLLRDDYKVALALDRNEVGFVHSGWEQYRKYFDDTGGDHPGVTTPVAPSLGRDLHLEIGKAWVDLGLTLPRWPRMVLGYEYDYKRGEEASTSWGAFGQGPDRRATYPASKELHEAVQIFKFSLDGDVEGVTVEERFRGELYRLDTHRTNSAARNTLGDNAIEGNRYFQGANTIRLEKQFKDWLFCSGGYLYSKLNADATFSDNVLFNNNPAFLFLTRVPQITLEKESHVFNLNAMAGPFDGLSASAGVQSEWTRQRGFGEGTLNRIAYTFSSPATLAVNPAMLSSDYDEGSTSEHLALRYTRIPFTAVFAEARLQQQTIGQNVADVQPASQSFLDNTSFSSFLTDARFGFNTSPWRTVSSSAHYRRYENESHYRDTQNNQPPGGYPGFLKSRDVLTDEVEASLVLRPSTWLKTTLSYKWVNSDYRLDTKPTVEIGTANIVTDGGSILAGKTESSTYSISTAINPARRLYLNATFSYQPDSTVTVTAGDPSLAPYRGHTYSLLGTATYVFTQNMDLFTSYSFSKADYGQHNSAFGLPLGIQYTIHAMQAGLTRRIGKNVSTRLQYGYYQYEEPSSGGANNYHAHSVWATLSFALP